MLENKMNYGRFGNLGDVFYKTYHAMAVLRGSADYPEIKGTVRFYQTEYGVVVAAEIMGLPEKSGLCEHPIFGFHIHEGDTCSGTESKGETEAFPAVGMHYNPHGCQHPYHAGDFPPLFGNEGYAFSAFLTNRFTVGEVVGRTSIVHLMADDFITQPAGNAGKKIACGEIKQYF